MLYSFPKDRGRTPEQTLPSKPNDAFLRDFPFRNSNLRKYVCWCLMFYFWYLGPPFIVYCSGRTLYNLTANISAAFFFEVSGWPDLFSLPSKPAAVVLNYKNKAVTVLPNQSFVILYFKILINFNHLFFSSCSYYSVCFQVMGCLHFFVIRPSDHVPELKPGPMFNVILYFFFVLFIFYQLLFPPFFKLLDGFITSLHHLRQWQWSKTLPYQAVVMAPKRSLTPGGGGPVRLQGVGHLLPSGVLDHNRCISLSNHFVVLINSRGCMCVLQLQKWRFPNLRAEFGVLPSGILDHDRCIKLWNHFVVRMKVHKTVCMSRLQKWRCPNHNPSPGFD